MKLKKEAFEYKLKMLEDKLEKQVQSDDAKFKVFFLISKNNEFFLATQRSNCQIARRNFIRTAFKRGIHRINKNI